MDQEKKERNKEKIFFISSISTFVFILSLAILFFIISSYNCVNNLIGTEAINMSRLISQETTLSDFEHNRLKNLDYTSLLFASENTTFEQDTLKYFKQLSDFEFNKFYVIDIIPDSGNVDYQGYLVLEAVENSSIRGAISDNAKFLSLESETVNKVITEQSFYTIQKINGERSIKGYYPIYSVEGSHIGSVVVEMASNRMNVKTKTILPFIIIFSILVIIAIVSIFMLAIRYNVMKKKSSYVSVSYHDPLTNLLNRRGFEGHLNESLEEAKKTDNKVALLVVDIDWFKDFNDNYGSKKGDDVLVEIADVIREAISELPEAKVGRLGGDEYNIFINNTSKDIVDDISNNIIAGVVALAIPSRTTPHKVITVSIGGICVVPQDLSVKNLYYVAQINLYSIKNDNKNDYLIS